MKVVTKFQGERDTNKMISLLIVVATLNNMKILNFNISGRIFALRQWWTREANGPPTSPADSTPGSFGSKSIDWQAIR